jgi:hypothetical protein
MNGYSINALQGAYGSVVATSSADYRLVIQTTGGTESSALDYTHPSNTKTVNEAVDSVEVSTGQVLYWRIISPPNVEALGYTITLRLDAPFTP